MAGVELAGALKNIIAIGAGMCDGFGYGDNAKAGFLTRGWRRSRGSGVAAGAQALTFIGLAGVGDLIATCYSPLSRNHRVGRRAGEGPPAGRCPVVAGPGGGGRAHRPSRREGWRSGWGVEMPITEKMYQVLFEGLDPHRGVAELMMREPRRELHGVQ